MVYVMYEDEDVDCLRANFQLEVGIQALTLFHVYIELADSRV